MSAISRYSLNNEPTCPTGSLSDEDDVAEDDIHHTLPEIIVHRGNSLSDEEEGEEEAEGDGEGAEDSFKNSYSSDRRGGSKGVRNDDISRQGINGFKKHDRNHKGGKNKTKARTTSILVQNNLSTSESDCSNLGNGDVKTDSMVVSNRLKSATAIADKSGAAKATKAKFSSGDAETKTVAAQATNSGNTKPTADPAPMKKGSAATADRPNSSSGQTESVMQRILR